MSTVYSTRTGTAAESLPPPCTSILLEQNQYEVTSSNLAKAVTLLNCFREVPLRCQLEHWLKFLVLLRSASINIFQDSTRESQ